MEIKSTLNKPYTDSERRDFIAVNNQQFGYKIKETETALEAWGYADAEKAKQTQITGLMAQLDAIDLKTIRPLRAMQAADFTDEDVAKLAELETQAQAIRQQIQELKGE